MTSPDTLLLLSGGLDSAYCAYRLLSEGRRLRLHHVHLRNHEGRIAHEARATERVLDWLRRHRLTAFEYTESSFDYGSLRFIVKDAYIWSFVIGVIMADPRSHGITKVIVPRHWDAFPTGPTGPGPARTDRVYREIPRQICGREPELEYPIVHMMKADIVRSMPPGLLECCWWCRTPKNGEPCHGCYTCRLVDPALEGVSEMLEAKVINRFKDKYTGRIYESGETYRHESEARMVELASLDPPRVEWPPVPASSEGTPGSASKPRHVGGGVYELPNGRRVRGREAALRAMAEG